jgi:glycosyltransferase involved in cell wall biosynthesis
MSPVKLIVDMTKLSNLNCGLGQVSLNYAKSLSEIKNDKFDLRFLVKRGQENVWGHDVKLIYASVWRRWFRVFNHEKGIWHSIHQDSDFVPSKKACKYILTIHDLNFMSEKSKKKAKKRLKILQKKVDRADIICFISQFAKDSAAKNLEMGDKPIHVIYNGVSKLNILAQKPRMISDKPFLFNIGVLLPKKNHQTIIEMMKFLPDYNLIIAGGGNLDYLNKLKQICKDNNLDDRVSFSGFISEAEKLWYYKNASAFVFPSLYEGFGLPVVEAMSEGLPVFCSDKSSLPEIGGDFAFYWKDFSPEKMASDFIAGMEIVRNDKDFATRLKKHANKFSWDENLKAYLELYSAIYTQ